MPLIVVTDKSNPRSLPDNGRREAIDDLATGKEEGWFGDSFSLCLGAVFFFIHIFMGRPVAGKSVFNLRTA